MARNPLRRRNPRYIDHSFRYGRSKGFLPLWKRTPVYQMSNPLSDLVLATMTQSDASLSVSFRSPEEDSGPEVPLP